MIGSGVRTRDCEGIGPDRASGHESLMASDRIGRPDSRFGAGITRFGNTFREYVSRMRPRCPHSDGTQKIACFHFEILRDGAEWLVRHWEHVRPRALRPREAKYEQTFPTHQRIPPRTSQMREASKRNMIMGILYASCTFIQITTDYGKNNVELFFIMDYRPPE